VYHAERAKYWQGEQQKAAAHIRETATVVVSEAPVTGGFRMHVGVDYGDAGDYLRLGEAYEKWQSHRDAAERFRSDAEVYGTQGDRVYELSLDDVHHFRLHGGERET